MAQAQGSHTDETRSARDGPCRPMGSIQGRRRPGRARAADPQLLAAGEVRRRPPVRRTCRRRSTTPTSSATASSGSSTRSRSSIPDRGIKFETYAIARIKGAIIDELRAMDWVPRSRPRPRPRDRARLRHAREPAASASRTTPRSPRRWASRSRSCRTSSRSCRYTSVVSFEELWVGGGDRDEHRRRSSATIEDETAEDPVAMFETAEIKDILAGAIERLPEREKIVIALVLLRGPDTQGDRRRCSASPSRA